MISKDEEIGKLRTKVKHLQDTLDENDEKTKSLRDELNLVKKQQLSLEQSLESEKATALQEMSRGKSSALQALQTELNNRHEQEKQDIKAELQQEMSDKLQLAEREKQVHIYLIYIHSTKV